MIASAVSLLLALVVPSIVDRDADRGGKRHEQLEVVRVPVSRHGTVDLDCAELLDWVDGVRNRRPFQGASAWDGYVAMRVTSACIQSLHTGAAVPVNLPEKPALFSI